MGVGVEVGSDVGVGVGVVVGSEVGVVGSGAFIYVNLMK